MVIEASQSDSKWNWEKTDIWINNSFIVNEVVEIAKEI